MSTGVKHVAVLIYNSYRDPLFQNLVMRYMQHQLDRGGFHFHLITFDHPDYRLSAEEIVTEKRMLLEKGVSWTPLNYHSGSMFLAKKLIDLRAAWKAARQTRKKHSPSALLTFGNVSGAFGALLKPVFRCKLIIYGYEPHALFMVDTGEWKRGGLKWTVLRRYEKLAEKRADYLLTGTTFYKSELEKMGLKNVFRAPSCVSQDIFKFDPQARAIIREELKINRQKVVIYAGKFGGLYYREETAQFCKGLLDSDGDFFFLILSPQPADMVLKLFAEAQVPLNKVHVLRANSPEEVAQYMSASDIGLNTIPPLPSQRFRSPIKVGEYLMCGLPFITCEGISEDDVYARKHNVGVVVPELSYTSGQQADPEIQSLLTEPSDMLRQRCRDTGIEYRGTHIVNDLLTEIFDGI